MGQPGSAPSARRPHAGAPGPSIYEPIQFGIDENGRPVEVTLIYRNLLAGRRTRLRQIGRAQQHRRPRRPVHRLQPVAVRRQDRRTRAVAHLSPTPSSATTSPTRSTPCWICRPRWTRGTRPRRRRRRKITQADGLTPIVCVIDELAYFSVTVGTKREQDEFKTLVRDLVARGRAAGIIVVAATQRPSADIIPTSLRDLFGYRVAFRCTTDTSQRHHPRSAGPHEGYSAATVAPETMGIGFLLAEGGIPRRFKAAYLTDEQVYALADAAAARRAATESPDLLPVTRRDRPAHRRARGPARRGWPGSHHAPRSTPSRPAPPRAVASTPAGPSGCTGSTPVAPAGGPSSNAPGPPTRPCRRSTCARSCRPAASAEVHAAEWAQPPSAGQTQATPPRAAENTELVPECGGDELGGPRPAHRRHPRCPTARPHGRHRPTRRAGHRRHPRRLRGLAVPRRPGRRLRPPGQALRHRLPGRAGHRPDHLRAAHPRDAGRADLHRLRQPPRQRLPVVRGDLPGRHLPARHRRTRRRQRHPGHRGRASVRVPDRHRPLVRGRPRAPHRPHRPGPAVPPPPRRHPVRARRRHRPAGSATPRPIRLWDSRCAWTATTTRTRRCGTCTSASCGGAR